MDKMKESLLKKPLGKKGIGIEGDTVDQKTEWEIEIGIDIETDNLMVENMININIEEVMIIRDIDIEKRDLSLMMFAIIAGN